MDFPELARDICQRFLPVDPEALVSGETFEVDGVPAATHWDRFEKPDRFTLVVDFGAAPQSDGDLHAAVLARNYELIGHDAGMLALEPKSLHVVHARTFEIGRAHALDVIDALMGSVEEAKTWRHLLGK